MTAYETPIFLYFSLKHTIICFYWWTRQRIHNTLYMGDKTIPDLAVPRMESFYPPIRRRYRSTTLRYIGFLYSQSECKWERLISNPVDIFVSNMWLDIHSTTACKLIFLDLGHRPTMLFWYWTVSTRHVEKSQIWSSHFTSKHRFWYSYN